MADTEKTSSLTGDKKIIEECREGLKLCIEDEEVERRKMMDDLLFCTLDQWPSKIRNERENDLENGPRPCLTIDKINQYIVQVVNDMRQGKPGINVRPMDDSADVETAKILKGIIRNIEDQSNADIAYMTGGESATKVGLGYWRIVAEYVSDESDDQELFIRPIPNTFSVYLDRHIYPDGSDAEKAWVVEKMPLEKFKELHPDAKSKGDDFDDLGDMLDFWYTEESITVVEHFCIERTPDKLHVLADGTAMLDSDYRKWPAEAGVAPEIVKTRSTFTKQLKWWKMTAVEVLDRRDLPGKYIPIVEVVGRESNVEGKRILWGLVRPAKDSLRMYNYFASTITEKMGLAPKTPWIVAEGQIEGREQEWKDSNKKNRAVLQYKAIDVNNNAVPAPQRVGPTPMEAALLHQMQVIEHDVQTSLGMFKAAVGETESQQSGRAILALQKESDTGTYHFGANLGVSIRHTGRILVDLIPHYYDTRRIVRIIGDDGTHQTVSIDPQQQESRRQVQGPQGIQSIYNPGVGKYDVAITVGPSYNTKRMEAAATLTEVVKSQPNLMPLIGDLLFRSLDFPYSDQIAERLKKMLPAPLQDSQGDPGVKLMQAMQKMQMMGAQMQEMQQENLQLKAGAQEGMAKVQVDAQAKAAQLQADQQQTAAELALQKAKQDGELQLAREKAQAEIAIKEAVAQAEHNIKAQDMALEHEHRTKELQFDQQVKAHEIKTEAEAKDATEAESLAPKLIQSMDALVKAVAQIVETQSKMQQAFTKPPPRTITAKSSSGQTMTATVQ